MTANMNGALAAGFEDVLRPLCGLHSSEETETPLSVFNYAAHVAKHIRLMASSTEIFVEIAFDRPELMSMTFFFDRSGRPDTYSIYCQLGSSQVSIPTWSGIPARVPDALDALHMFGMTIDALGATLRGVTALEAEENLELCTSGARTDWPFAGTARMDPPDHQRPVGHGIASPGVEQARFCGNRRHTPVALFNRVAKIADAIRRALGNTPPHLISIWCSRADGFEYLELTVLTEPESITGSCPWKCITIACRHGGDRAIVHAHTGSVAEGLHLVGMLALALGITRFELGSFDNELNDALAAPSQYPLTWKRRRAPSDHQRQLTWSAGL